MGWEWLIVPAAYLVGSVSPAYWAGRIKGIDLRQHGSGNLGATNAGRVLGGKWFAAVFLLDLLKGAVPVLIARRLDWQDDGSWLPLLTGAAAILGHGFTCFHGFKGGKAVATSLGVIAALVWKVALACLAVWLIAWLIGKFAFRAGAAGAVGPASVLAAAAVPFAVVATDHEAFRTGHLPVTIFLFAVSLLVIVRHRSNIAKLFKR